jgi:hypothetical protein
LCPNGRGWPAPPLWVPGSQPGRLNLLGDLLDLVHVVDQLAQLGLSVISSLPEGTEPANSAIAARFPAMQACRSTSSGAMSDIAKKIRNVPAVARQAARPVTSLKN